MAQNYLGDILHAISQGLLAPTILLLLAFIGYALFCIGSVVAEYFTERRHFQVAMPKLLAGLMAADDESIPAIIEQSGLLKRQKVALLTVYDYRMLPGDALVALIKRLVNEEESRYDRISGRNNTAARVSPMLGLMGTLIPLGPGIEALGRADTSALSSSLLIAFDTTVAGLVVAAVCLVIGKIRSNWYNNYMTALDSAMATMLQKIEDMRAQGKIVEEEPSDYAFLYSKTIGKPEAGAPSAETAPAESKPAESAPARTEAPRTDFAPTRAAQSISEKVAMLQSELGSAPTQSSATTQQPAATQQPTATQQVYTAPLSQPVSSQAYEPQVQSTPSYTPQPSFVYEPLDSSYASLSTTANSAVASTATSRPAVTNTVTNRPAAANAATSRPAVADASASQAAVAGTAASRAAVAEPVVSRAAAPVERHETVPQQAEEPQSAQVQSGWYQPRLRQNGSFEDNPSPRLSRPYDTGNRGGQER